MATIDRITQGTTGHPARQFRKEVYTLRASVDFADAVTTKGSALATSDVIQIIQIPAGTQVVGGNVRVTDIASGGVTTAKMNIGTSGSTASLTSDAALMTSGYPSSTTLNLSTLYATATTLDIVLASVTGSFTAGTVEVQLFAVDVT